MGFHYGQAIEQQFPDLDQDIIIQGLIAGINNEEDPVYDTPEKANIAVRAYMKEVSDRKAKENLEKGEAFLAENAKKDGVKVTDSGLQYEVIEEGNGPKPTAQDTVIVKYTGTNLDGEIFDSSDLHGGEPSTFTLNRVIRGWSEGILLMSVGSKYKFYIPAELAYGAQDRGPKISPNSMLIFDVELVGIK